jgi:DNA-binding MarR family transcriptional regulator
MRIGTSMATGFDQHFAEIGISQAQFRMLLAVWMHGGAEGIAPSQLAEHLFLERGTVSVLSERLVKLGWLARQPGDDRRSIRLALTESGGATLRQVTPLAIQLAEETLNGIAEADLRAMLTNLERIESKLRDSRHKPADLTRMQGDHK